MWRICHGGIPVDRRRRKYLDPAGDVACHTRLLAHGGGVRSFCMRSHLIGRPTALCGRRRTCLLGWRLISCRAGSILPASAADPRSLALWRARPRCWLDSVSWAPPPGTAHDGRTEGNGGILQQRQRVLDVVCRDEPTCDRLDAHLLEVDAI